MATIGVLAAEHIAVGLVEDHQLTGTLRIHPNRADDEEYLTNLPAEEIARALASHCPALSCTTLPMVPGLRGRSGTRGVVRIPARPACLPKRT